LRLASEPLGRGACFFPFAPRFRSEKVGASQNSDHATAARSFFAFMVKRNALPESGVKERNAGRALYGERFSALFDLQDS
jgi:hypothetical protein